jgi:hypothetical protein
MVERLQDKIISCLRSMLARNHPEDPSLFAKLIMKIPGGVGWGWGGGGCWMGAGGETGVVVDVRGGVRVRASMTVQMGVAVGL